MLEPEELELEPEVLQPEELVLEPEGLDLAEVQGLEVRPAPASSCRASPTWAPKASNVAPWATYPESEGRRSYPMGCYEVLRSSAKEVQQPRDLRAEVEGQIPELVSRGTLVELCSSF